MSSLDTITRRIAEEQDRILSGQNFVGDAREQLSFDPSSYPRKTRTIPIVAAASVALAAAAAVALMIMPSAVTVEANGVGLEVGAWVASEAGESTDLAFSDGSRIHLKSSSGLRVQDLHPEGAHLLLERGEVNVKVNHFSDTNWKLDVGPYLITVTGTRFDVSWDPEKREFALDMDEGSVRVEGPMISSGARLAAGETLRASLSEKRLEITADGETDAVAVSPSDNNMVPADPSADDEPAPTLVENDNDKGFSPSGSRPAPRPSWKSLAKQGRYAEAVALAETAGIRRISGTASAADLMTLGDAARHVGNTPTASTVYKAVRKRFPGTSHASAAAFALGKIAFDRKRTYGEAARWFRACLADSKTGVLEREASGRLMESLDRSGDSSGATTAATQYLKRFPGGPHAPLARKLAAQSR